MRRVHLGAKAVAALVAALLAMSGQATAQEAVGETTGALPQKTSTSPIEKDGVNQAAPTESTGSGMILVSKRPIEVLAGPSSSASVMYGFPAGRRFRLIGRDAGFAQIQDLKSGATGWIDETALGQSPRVPEASVPSEPKPAPRTKKATTASVEPKPKTTKRHAETPTPQQHPVQTPKRRGIFGVRRNSAQGVLF